MLLRRLYFRYFKHKVNKDWNETELSSEIQSEYEKYLPQIRKIYKNVTYWHGTGRYHYDTKGKSKYELQSIPSDIVDSFQQILKEKRLKIQHDPWAVSNNKYSSSISTTQWRMYARIYAEIHMNESESIFPVFAQRKDVINFFIYYSLLASPPIAYYKGLRLAFDPKKLATQGPSWFSTINSEIESKGNALSDLNHILGKCSSNIQNNYGILFGINEKDLKEAKMNPLLEMFETRFPKDIPLDRITHLEVPIKYLNETKQVLLNNNVSLDVLPIEYCEMYQATQGIIFTMNSAPNVLPTFKYKELIKHYKLSSQKK